MELQQMVIIYQRLCHKKMTYSTKQHQAVQLGSTLVRLAWHSPTQIPYNTLFTGDQHTLIYASRTPRFDTSATEPGQFIMDIDYMVKRNAARSQRQTE